jgi:hypothetical protein
MTWKRDLNCGALCSPLSVPVGEGERPGCHITNWKRYEEEREGERKLGREGENRIILTFSFL